ncbi:sperm-associated antigen 5 isoform X1 [Podarcis raffonei]|uniref:sperm-associated antigen 5 isoform X1 n=1 Tax=Podarcis raffonei TaxID=65483 RepID=UPI00232971E1|nr:sperm-associated antigen 5 isoform X1 [Podarcis raffonei]
MEPPSQEWLPGDSLRDSHPQEMAEPNLALETPKREGLPFPALEDGKSVAPGSAATGRSPQNLLEAGPNASSENKASVQQEEKNNGLTSVSPLNFLEVRPNASLQDKGSILHPEKDNGLISVPQLSLPEAGPNASLQDKASVQEQEEDNGLTSVSVMPEATWTSPLRLPEAGPNACSGDEGSDPHPEKDNGLISVPQLRLPEAGPNASLQDKASVQQEEKDNGLISVSPLSLLEVRPNACSEDKTSVHKQEKSSLTPVFVASEMTWTSPLRLLEADSNASSEDKGSILHPEKDNGLISVPQLSLPEAGPNVSLQDKASVQEQEEDNGLTSVSVMPEATWTSPLRLPEAGPNACSEDEGSVHEQEKDNGITSVSVVPEMTWTLPSWLPEAELNACSEDKGSILHPENDNGLISVPQLSLPEPGPSESLQDKASVQQQQKDNSLTSVSVVPEVTWTSPSRLPEAGPNACSEDEGSDPHPEKDNGLISAPQLRLPEAGPNASLQDKASVQEQEEDNSLTSVSPLRLLEAGPNVSSEDQEQEKDNGIISTFVSPAASQILPLNILETRLSTSPMNTASVLWQQRKAAVSLVSAATWMSPLSLLETGVNTSLEERTLTKDSTAETDSLLWHLSQDQLRSLSREELEEHLASSQIVVEALSREIRDCLNSQRLPACVGPAEQRDAATQTPISEPSQEVQLYREMYEALWKRHDPLQKTLKNQRALVERLATAKDEMRGCLLDSTFLRETAEASFQRLQDDRRSLSQQQKQLGNLISHVRERWSRIEDERKKTLRDKEAADHVLELFRNHATQRIGQLEQDCGSRRHLRSLLVEANALQSDLSGGYAKHLAEEACLATALQSNWAKMRRDYEAMRTLAGRFQVTMGQMVQKMRAAQQELAQHHEASLLLGVALNQGGGCVCLKGLDQAPSPKSSPASPFAPKTLALSLYFPGSQCSGVDCL